MNRKAQSIVEQSRREVQEQRAKLSRLEADKTKAESALEALQARAGDAVLDDPDAAGQLAREMQELRDRIDMTARAAVAQRPRVAAAETAYLHAEADLLERAAEGPRAALKRHQDRTAELLRQLEEHEGRYVPEHLLIDEQLRHAADRFEASWETPKSFGLETAVVEAELPGLLVRDMAAGRDPGETLNQHAGVEGRIGTRRPHEFYPACVWGPDALVPAPAYLRTVETRTAQLAGLRTTTIPAARAKIAALEEALEEAKTNGDTRQLQPSPPGPPGLSGKTVADKLATAQAKLQKLLDDETRLVDELTALTGRAPADVDASAIQNVTPELELASVGG